ncbi:hypothetical protein [Persephonella sp.]
MKNKRVIYFASGFPFINKLRVELQDFLMEIPDIKEGYSLIFPEMLDNHLQHEYVFTDLYYLGIADILVVYMPEPSIGASMELAYFKTKFPDKPAILYNSIEHGWLEHFADIRVNSREELLSVLKNFLRSHRIII